MAEVVRMPRMSDTMKEGIVVGWLKQEGDTIEAGDILAEVQTDKATMDLESYFDGVLLHIAVEEGAVPINGVLAVIGDEGEDWQAAIAASDADEAGTTGEAKEPEAETSTPTEATPTPTTESGERIKASPLARRMAEEANIDLSTVTGTGENGRVVKKDIEALIDKKSSASPQPAAPTAPTPAAAPAPAAKPAEKAPAKPAAEIVPFTYGGGGANYEDVSVTPMRQVISRRLGESKFTAPHFYLTVEINMGKAMEWRKRINEVSPTKISFNDIVVKATAASLREHPAVNSSWLGDIIRVNKDVNIGVAVAVDEGLLVPVIRYADIKTLSQINSEVRTLAGKAKKLRLQPQEMEGSTFTISNLGMFGIEEFTAIINPPNACILAVGGIKQKPIVENGEITVGNIMKVTLSCDHRVVDGASGAQFLNTLKTTLENPIKLLV